MQQEYKYVSSQRATKLVEILNEHPEEGWELVSVVYNENLYSYVAFLRRDKTDEKNISSNRSELRR
jgi:hypothetical protein